MNNIFSNKNSALSKMSFPMKYIALGVLFLLLIGFGFAVDFTPPITTFNSNQITSTTDMNITLNCNDNYIFIETFEDNNLTYPYTWIGEGWGGIVNYTDSYFASSFKNSSWETKKTYTFMATYTYFELTDLNVTSDPGSNFYARIKYNYSDSSSTYSEEIYTYDANIANFSNLNNASKKLTSIELQTKKEIGVSYNIDYISMDYNHITGKALINSTNPINGSYDLQLTSVRDTEYRTGQLYINNDIFDSNNIQISFYLKTNAISDDVIRFYLTDNSNNGLALQLFNSGTSNDNNFSLSLLGLYGGGGSFGAIVSNIIYSDFSETKKVVLDFNYVGGLLDILIYNTSNILLYSEMDINIFDSPTFFDYNDTLYFSKIKLYNSVFTVGTSYAYFDDITITGDTGSTSGCKTINYNINNEGWNTKFGKNLILDTNPKHYFRFEETSGTNVIDSINDINGTSYNVTVNQNGKVGKAYSYNGTTSYSRINGVNGGTDTSWGAWIYSTNYNDGDAILSHARAGGSGGWNIYEIRPATNKIAIVISSPSAHTTYTGSINLTNSQWYYINVLVKNNGFIALYVNGVLDTNWTMDYAIQNNQADIIVGAGGDPAIENFAGIIDEFGYWNKILSQTEINELYNGGTGFSFSNSNDINSYSFLYSGAGDHNIQYYSTDNADNNEAINTSTFSTYGLAKFAFYDEDTEALLNDVIWTVSPSIGGVSGGTLTDSNTLDLNLQGITSQEYTFTFTKTGYGPRTYVRTLNQYSDIDLNFALLSNSLSDDIPFKIYQTDETTIYTNTIVELYRPDNNFVIGRKKTNSTGNVTFSIHVSDQNYYVRVDDGAFTYQPVALTIYYPKNEETLLQITEYWKIEITQNLYETYSDLNTNKIIYLLPNTSLPFNIKISDMNGNFFTRTYAQQFFGDPRTAELQPYLVSTTTGLLTTITTKDAISNTNIGGVTIKIYKFISGEGRTLVEQVITDAKGQAITLLIAGAEYSFECYYGGVLIKTFEITSTSTTIFIMLDLGSIIEVPDPSGYQATFTPKGTGLINQGVGTVAFTQTMYNYGGKTVSLTSRILQGGVVISQQTANTSLTSYTFTHTINWVDINQTTITSRIIINDGTTNYTFNQNYNITTFFDTNYSILDGLQNGLRRDFTCDPNGICFPLLALAIFISIALVIGATIGIGQFGVQSVAIIFLSSMILFTYLNWVPFILTIVLAVLTFAFIVSERSV